MDESWLATGTDDDQSTVQLCCECLSDWKISDEENDSIKLLYYCLTLTEKQDKITYSFNMLIWPFESVLNLFAGLQLSFFFSLNKMGITKWTQTGRVSLLVISAGGKLDFKVGENILSWTFFCRKTFHQMVKPAGQYHHQSWSICPVPGS